VTGVPLDEWAERLGATPAQLRQLARASDELLALWGGWTRASIWQNNAAWATALLSARLNQVEPLDTQLQMLTSNLFDVLTREQRETFACDFIQAHPGWQPREAERRWLDWNQKPWGLPLSRQVFDQLIPYMRSLPAFDANDRDSAWLKELGYRLHPALLDEGRQRLSDVAEHQPQWARAVDEALAAWQFRHDMLKELTR